MTTNKTVLVTGGSRGIGRGIVRYFASRQTDIVFTYRSAREEAETLCHEIQDTCGVKCFAVQMDVTDPKAVRSVFEFIDNEFGKLDILVNNAGVIRDRNLLTMDWQEWYEVIDTNLNGAFHMSKSATFKMLRQKSGAIVNIASTAGLVGVQGQTNYSATKAGLIGFTRSLAMECAGRSVRVNAVVPGFIETDMTVGLSEKQREEILEKIPLKKYGQVEDVAALVYFLANEEAQYITGQAFVVDGGLTAC
jgi:3-oxoacyl-[acyl-carrier protein] reductase